MPRVIPGKTRLRAHPAGLSPNVTKPDGGTQRMRTPKNQASTIPSQKTGTASASPWYQPRRRAGREPGWEPA
jgi:hypothetical protein